MPAELLTADSALALAAAMDNQHIAAKSLFDAQTAALEWFIEAARQLMSVQGWDWRISALIRNTEYTITKLREERKKLEAT